MTDDGTAGTPVHPNCPCIGDYPHIGVDSRGFYLTTNEYSFFGPEFNSAQIYAFSKRASARSDADVLVTQFDTTAADAGLNGFTIWPAQSPTIADYSSSARGTEFFLSSNAAEEATGTPDYISNSIVTWSLTNTASLDSRTPNPRLSNTRVAVDTYSLPPPANQKAGSVPLADCLNQDACATVLLGGPDPFKPNVEGPLDSNDTRMQQVSYVNGRLVGALDTAVTISGKKLAGIGWYIVQPRSDRDRLRANLADQGQFGLANNNVIYPAIGVNSSGRGVMAFTLVGDGTSRRPPTRPSTLGTAQDRYSWPRPELVPRMDSANTRPSPIPAALRGRGGVTMARRPCPAATSGSPPSTSHKPALLISTRPTRSALVGAPGRPWPTGRPG